jgi:hypothetical protein
MILEEEENDNLLVYCMSQGTKDIFKKTENEGYYSSLIGRYLMDSEMKYRNSFRVSKEIFQSINFSPNSSL